MRNEPKKRLKFLKKVDVKAVLDASELSRIHGGFYITNPPTLVCPTIAGNTCSRGECL